MSRERREQILKIELEKLSADLYAKIVKELKVKGTYGVVFALDGEKIYTQEFGNVNPKTAGDMLVYLLDQKAKEIAENEQAKAKRNRTH